jgi:long-subunit acyl-CoA synthetase (AMP-forming)
VVDGERSFDYRSWRGRSRRFASALRQLGLQKGDRVAFLALNSEPLLLAHFAVPQAGGVLVAINTRLNPEEIGYILEHSGSKLVFHSPELAGQLARGDFGEILARRRRLHTCNYCMRALVARVTSITERSRPAKAGAAGSARSVASGRR